MSEDEIRQMRAGREMDALVAQLIMGLIPCEKWYYANFGAGGGPVSVKGPCNHDNCYPASERLPFGGPRHYSTDIAAAWEVLEEMNRRENRNGVYAAPHYGNIEFFDGDYIVKIQGRIPSDTGGVVNATGDTAPLAICRAALLAVTEEK